MATEVEAAAGIPVGAGAGPGVGAGASAAGANSAAARATKNPNKVRKRAPKACLSCRARKVRCDVSQRGRPCMNCYLDSETCVVTGRASRLRKSQRPPVAAPAGGSAPAGDAGATTGAPSTAPAPSASATSGQSSFLPQADGHNHSHNHNHNHSHGHDHSHDHDASAHGHSHASAPQAAANNGGSSQGPQAQAQQQQHSHHNHGHSHSHSHSHSHTQAHQHGSPQSDTSRHRTVSIKGSPSATRESEPPQPQQQQQQQQHASHSSPMAPPEVETQQQHRHNHNHNHSHSHHNNQNQNNSHNQQTRFNSFNDDHNHHGSFNRNNDFMGAGAGAGAGGGLGGLGGMGGGSAPWAAEQGLNISADITYSYYPFLAISNLSGILPQDVNYLELQGCLRVPTRSILDEFVQQYFLHVHPLLPLFNEGDFWELYCQQPGGGGGGPSGEGRMSLLVFQALLFATCNFVSRNSIRALGFSTIRLARAALYRRAKLLYDFETESSPAAIAQAALLLSFWSPSTNSGTKNPNTAWLCTAIQQAKLAEANHYAQLLPFEARRANTLKRLWWCCIIRDRVMGLGVRRSIQITRAHFDLEANPPLTRADLADEIERSRVYNPGTKSCLIEILVHMVELCVVLTDILTLVFPADDTPGWGRQIADGDAGRVRQCKIELRRWYKDVALKFPMFGGGSGSSSGGSPGSTTGNPGSGNGGGGTGAGTGVSRMANGGREFYHDSVILYTNLMYMYYHSSRVALCHHEVLHIAVNNTAPGFANNGSKAVPIIYENRYELQDAASGVTECLKELIQLRLARWLPISAVACTALPLFLHILDVKLSTSAANNANNNNASANTPNDVNGGHPDHSTSASSALKQHRLNILIEAMKTYQPQYDGVDWVSETIRHIVNLANLDGNGSGNGNGNGNGGNGGNNAGISDWTDILASNPSLYLRLALTMDLALSKNRMPEERDFPVGLRGLFTSGFSSVRNLRLDYNKDGNQGNNGNNGGNSGNDASNGHGSMNNNSSNDHSSHNSNNNSGSGNNNRNSGNHQYASNNNSNNNSMTNAAAMSNNNGMAIDANNNMNMHVDAPQQQQQQHAMPSAPTPNLVNMMDDPASVAAAMGGLAANGGLIGGIAGPGGLGMPGVPGGADFAGGDYSAAFMLAPHHLAMSMGMAMGMDMDMDLTDMDMDMAFPTTAGGLGASTGLTPGIVTQLPSSDEETSPASIMSGGTTNSEAGHSPAATHHHMQAQQAQRNYMVNGDHPNGAMLDAYTFNNGNGIDGAGAGGSPGTTATDVDDRHDAARRLHPSGGSSNNIKRDKGAPAEGDEWIEPSWDDEVPELREGDRDTARALLEAIGESA
ncbi:hypothetical protein SBRCBS47491_002596 [Sporothrix bragantina]|uniref:Zn(2)-C6 fungal-type domain-containing protein n=1 Tax=Sporothrix bragantina TaxID=671064 RepID=A0ABP0B867_9PEZI